MSDDLQPGQFVISDDRLSDLNNKLLEFGHDNSLAPYELSIVLKLASEWIAKTIGLDLTEIEVIDLETSPDLN